MAIKKSKGKDQQTIPGGLPLLPVRDLVVYPFMIMPLFVGRESSIRAVESSLEASNRLILLAGQKDMSVESPAPEEIFSTGTVAMIMRTRKLPDGRLKVLVQGLFKAKVLNFEQTRPFFRVEALRLEDKEASAQDGVVALLARAAREKFSQLATLGQGISPEAVLGLDGVGDPGRLGDLMASSLGLPIEDGQRILEALDPVEKLKIINDILSEQLEGLGPSSSSENPLRDQMMAIKLSSNREFPPHAPGGPLGGEADDEISEFRSKIYGGKFPPEAKKEALKQLSRLEKMHPDSSESSIVRTYLEWLTELPWGVFSQEEVCLSQARKILDEDHFDLEKAKERILEFLAVRQLKSGQMKGPILCFSGPPGVGKTSLGKSIAKAMGRKFVRISLGGVGDEGEIRGHRRTYVGSMPGRVIQALKQVQTCNPVILLDEVDKLGHGFKGDPSSALLEVLDPEQNEEFRDHYMNLPFDLSNVLFIATANVIENIPGPLMDRMEVISLTGYSHEEKVAISKKFLIKKQMEENGISRANIGFSDRALLELIKNFTAEAGLRNLERNIGGLCRKVAMRVAQGNTERVSITPAMVEQLLGPPPHKRDELMAQNEVGVANGLAWTPVGGEVLCVEVTNMKGKGLTLTGRLGEVMKESAQTAIGLIRAHADYFGIEADYFDQNEIHIHLPSGGIPKDGPSAGITLATAIVSLVTNIPVRKDVAMTGEITLTGKVLSVGGIEEKALAAMRMNIPNIILPEGNRKDVASLNRNFTGKINFIFVKNLKEVLEHALPQNGKKSKSFPAMAA